MAGIIGSPIHDLDTPALLVDGSAMVGNIERMASYFRDRPAQLRPHFKNHKCSQIARRQLAAGSVVGMTAAKLSEAQVLVEAGVSDVLIANQVVGVRKTERLVELARRADIRVAVDHIDQVVAISQAANAVGATLGLLIEVDIGMRRCGVQPGEPALSLARQIIRLPGVRFDGLQAYEGHLVNVIDVQERRGRVEQAFAQAIETRRLLEKSGIPVSVISGGSSSTYAITGNIKGIDEIQAGTYVTMDTTYTKLVPEFEIALSILTRVISRPAPGIAVVDIGVKGVGDEFGAPQVKGRPETNIPNFSSEEHCVIHQSPDWKIGDAVELIPSHACTSCNLHREILVQENGRIIDVWPIEASGCLR